LNNTAAIRNGGATFTVRAAAVLIAASLVVAVAILVDGSAARGINGIGGLLWIGSAVVLGRSLAHEHKYGVTFGVVAVECLALVLFVKPSNLAWAIIGFALGGAATALLASSRSYDWALLLPALWLPVHLLVAISRSLVRALTGGEAAVRSEPPPTAALVPFAMVISAIAGAWLVERWRNRARGANSLVESQ
jgi:hypothetical protein